MPKLHALLIAINNYHPQSRVSSLAGCINDRNAVRDFVQKNYQDLDPQITLLSNEEATRKNIISTFREKIVKKARKGDTVLLYYAGHGSFSTSADAFKSFDGLGQDETFVCYDSRLAKNHDLTDKELAVLLAEIKQDVHTVVVADSCHSASVTRMVNFIRNPEEDTAAEVNLVKKRFFQPRNTTRNLDSYLLDEDNYYTKLGSNISIPRSKHLLLSACDRNEEAWETKQRRGLFTTMLLAELKQNINISYQDLFARVRTKVYNVAKNQLPTIYPFEGFNPNTVFLRPTLKPNSSRHQIIKTDSGEWRMELGAINGLPTAETDLAKIIIGIYEGIGVEAKFIGSSGVSKMHITQVTLNKSKLLKSNKIYWGEIQTFPSALIFNLTGRKKSVQSFLKDYEKKPSPFVQLIPKFKTAKYNLHVTKSKFTLKKWDTKEVVTNIKRGKTDSYEILNKRLKHLVDWENIATLKNKNSTILDSLEIQFLEEKSPNNFEFHKGNDITIDYHKKGADTTQNKTPKPIWYKIRAKNTSDKDLFVSLLHLNANFGIAAYFPSEIIRANSDWKVLDDQHGLIIEKQQTDQVLDLFKIIVSTKDFDEYKYLLEDIPPPKRGTVSRPRFEATEKEDWYAETLRVQTIRPQGSIGSRAVNIAGITFEKHENFKAEVTLAPIEKTTRSIHPSNNLVDIFIDSGVSIMNFGEKGTRSIEQGRSVIELSGIENSESLKEQPLILKVDAGMGEGGEIIPVTTKNGFIIPLGTSVKLPDGSIQIQIDGIPEGTDAPPATQGKRSLGRALWFSLLKFAGLKEETFLLRKVKFENGAAKRTPLYKSNIERAKNILLVTHGIIGDTKSMIANLSFLKEEKHYDLILTFDYENLNTKIEDIAVELNEKLTHFGLGKDDNKNFDILAHSMGGLVSRYLIEFIRKGDDLVDHLFMFGTPNGGSIFGEIPIFRDKLVKLLTVSLNFGKVWLGWVGTALGVVNKVLIGSKIVTKTLAQMSSNSEFIENLAAGEKGHTKYTIVAGDISDYENIKEARLARFVESVLLKIGETANAKKPNDIAVLVEDIRAVPDRIEPLKYDVCCHHLNYFESEEGLRILREVVIER